MGEGANSSCSSLSRHGGLHSLNEKLKSAHAIYMDTGTHTFSCAAQRQNAQVMVKLLSKQLHERWQLLRIQKNWFYVFFNWILNWIWQYALYHIAISYDMMHHHHYRRKLLLEPRQSLVWQSVKSRENEMYCCWPCCYWCWCSLSIWIRSGRLNFSNTTNCPQVRFLFLEINICTSVSGKFFYRPLMKVKQVNAKVRIDVSGKWITQRLREFKISNVNKKICTNRRTLQSVV